LFRVPDGYTSRQHGLHQSVWLVLHEDTSIEQIHEGCSQIPADASVQAAICLGRVPAQYDAAGQLWQCTQHNLTEAGRFLLCDLIDNLRPGLKVSLWTLHEAPGTFQVVSQSVN
jgi:hypothetical protein